MQNVRASHFFNKKVFQILMFEILMKKFTRPLISNTWALNVYICPLNDISKLWLYYCYAYTIKGQSIGRDSYEQTLQPRSDSDQGLH